MLEKLPKDDAVQRLFDAVEVDVTNAVGDALPVSVEGGRRDAAHARICAHAAVRAIAR